MRALTLPDSPTALAGWLESELVGLQLRRLAAELATVHRDSPAPIGTFDDWLATYRDSILRRGLRSVPPERLAALLRRPDWLLDLQQLVLTEGSHYWDSVPRDEDLDERAERNWLRLNDWSHPPAIPSTVHRGIWSQTIVPALAASLVTAAAVLLVVFVAPQFLGNRNVVVQVGGNDKSFPPTESPRAWGFGKFAQEKPNIGREEYLQKMATSALEWTKQRPTDASGVSRRLGEFRQGCSEILLAEHQPLTPEDRAWLKDRCRKWAEALDRHRAAVESGADPLAVRTEVDETVTKIAAALLGRAETPT